MSEQDPEHDVTAATETLASLNAQVQGVRAELGRLRRELAKVQSEVGGRQPAHLIEANEQLVISALRSETIAEAAVSELGDMSRIAQHDALTDTANRALMLDRLENAIHMARRRGTRLAVFFVDLDNFKEINDTQGHAVGDEVLQLVARRLESVVRDSDTVSRHGGDEFLVLLADVAQESDAAQIATKMLSALAEPCGVGDQTLSLSASLGIAIYPEHGNDPASLISHADAAMYRSKKSGYGSFEFHCEGVATE